MDKELILPIISQSKYCEFVGFLNDTRSYRGDIQVRLRVKDPNKKLPKDFSFDIALFLNPTHDRTNDNGVGLYSGHWIFTQDEGFEEVNTIINQFANIMNSQRKNWSKGEMISIKPLDQYDESILELIDRWGKKFTELEYKKTFERFEEKDIDAPLMNKKIKVLYSSRGEIRGYNKIMSNDHNVILSYDEDGKKIDYHIPKSAKYIGNRIGPYYCEAQETKEHRIKELLGNGNSYMKQISNINVFVVGCGGIGANVVDFLTRKGVKNITVYDDDIVEVKNCQRLPLEAMKYIGQPKVNIFRDINGINYTPKNIKISNDNSHELISADLVIMGSDNVEARNVVSNLVTKHNIPYINCGVGFRNDNSFATMSYYGAPGIISNITNGVENKDDEYNKTINLQLCEYVVMVAAKAADIVSRTCGLYADDCLDSRKGWTDHE